MGFGDLPWGEGLWGGASPPPEPVTVNDVRRMLLGVNTFLGKGLMSPLTEDPVTGDFMRVSDEANVKQCLKDGLLTAIGERVLNEGLGTIVPEMVFEESEVVRDLTEPSIKDYVEQFEPRVILQSVKVTQTNGSADMSAFSVFVSYIIRATNRRENLVFPFYLTSQQG